MLGEASPRHPPEGFQVLAELLEAVSGRNELLLTPLNQSLLHHLHTDGLQPGNLQVGRHTTYTTHATAPSTADEHTGVSLTSSCALADMRSNSS